ncbi:MAG TPA: DMT family transporter [Microlunatus sp.]|nr:DMT family transporter [Microlunatus sp.]
MILEDPVIGALVLALLSASFFAVGSAVQHQSAGTAPRSSKRKMVLELVRRRGWLLGAGLSAVAFALHAVALTIGELSVVQPAILTGIVFSVVARSALERHLPTRGEAVWVIVTWAGLALFLLVLHPDPPRQPDRTAALIMLGLAVVLVLVMGYLARRSERRRLLRGILLGSSAGILFGLVAGLLKLSSTTARQDLGQLLGQWPVWLLVVLGGSAVLLNQRAYQSTRMSVSTPVLNICQLFVSLAFGVVVFHERLFASPGRMIIELAGLAIMVFGVVRLAMLAAPQSDGPGRADDDARATAVADGPAADTR